MVGAALRGFGKVLGKHLKKVPVLGKHVKKARGTPTKAGLVARRSALRGDPIIKGVKAPKKISKVDFGVGVGTGALTMHLINKAKKEAKAEDKTKEKLTKSVEEHKKKTKEQKEKQKK